MKVFLDANIIVGLLNRREAGNHISADVLKLCHLKKFEVYISPITVAIAFYYIKKSFLRSYTPKQTFAEFLSRFSFTSNLPEDINHAMQINFEDVEDALQYISAERLKADIIVTSNAYDYYSSVIPALDPMDFLIRFSD